MRKNTKRTFTGLPGVLEHELPGLMVNSLSGALRNLGPSRVCSDAGDVGAVTVWIDSAGSYRCAFTNQWAVIDTVTVTTKQAVKRWLQEWIPKMHLVGSTTQARALAMCRA